MKSRHWCLACCMALMSLMHTHGVAQQTPYPSRPIRFVVPFPAGGSADGIARIIAQQMTQAMGQQWLVDNRPGADGILAGTIVLKSAPDGHTVFFGSNTPLAGGPAFRKAPPYDPVKDFTAIGFFGHFTFYLFVSPTVPVKSLSELVDHARANPGKLNYGSGNATGIVTGAQLKLQARLDVTHVPYKGDAATTADLIGGRIQYAFMAPVPAFEQARAGRLRMLAVLAPKRSPHAPELPTVAEAGMPGVSITPWAGLFGPAGIPPAIVSRISRDLNAAIVKPDIREQISRQGIEVQPTTPAELAAHVREQYQAWVKVVAETGIPRD